LIATICNFDHWPFRSGSFEGCVIDARGRRQLHRVAASPRLLTNLGNGSYFRVSFDTGIGSTLNAMLPTAHLGERPHPVVASAARELLLL
jgi:hypothetical protein